MSISIIIPCRNEEKTIVKTIVKIKKHLFGKIKEFEFIIINDFSEDNTYKICKKFSKKKSIIMKKLIPRLAKRMKTSPK